MKSLTYVRPTDVHEAVEAIATTENAKLLAGGTNLVDLMRADIEHRTSRSSPTAGCGWVRWSATADWPRTRWYARVTRCSRRRS
jgi:hypothetical protein